MLHSRNGILPLLHGRDVGRIGVKRRDSGDLLSKVMYAYGLVVIYIIIEKVIQHV